MRIRQLVFMAMACTAVATASHAQSLPDSLSPAFAKVSQKYISAVDGKAAAVSEALDKKTVDYLDKLEAQEQKLKNRLSKIDSLAAKNIFADSRQQYENIQQKLASKAPALLKNTGRYLPWLDSAGTSLKFLQTNPALSNLQGNATKLNGALSKVKGLEDQFKQAGSVQEFIRQRKEYLTEQLRNYNLGSDLKKYNQTAYYYTQQVNEYKQALDDPDKAMSKGMQLLRKLPAFNKFFHDHGELAGLFDVPADYASTGMAGMQTVQQVQAVMGSQMRQMGPNGQQIAQQGIAAAQAELTKLRNQFPSQGSTQDMPDFKPNQQKTKSFLKRLQYGTNMQTVHSNYYFPTTTDIALSVGYKLGGQNIVGIGASYKLGWGKDIKHIAITSEGMGVRSFVDIKVKGSFFASGGLEYNYQQPFYTLRELYHPDGWSTSGLLGVSKVVSLKTKFFKQTKLQLLWDFLSYQQLPKTQPFKFRVGYNF